MVTGGRNSFAEHAAWKSRDSFSCVNQSGRDDARSKCLDRKLSGRKVLAWQYRSGHNVWFSVVKLAISIRHLSIVTFGNSVGDSEFLKNNEFDVFYATTFSPFIQLPISFFICNFNDRWLPSITRASRASQFWSIEPSFSIDHKLQEKKCAWHRYTYIYSIKIFVLYEFVFNESFLILCLEILMANDRFM